MTDKIADAPANVYTALAAAQLEFGAVQKGSVNPAFKSRYADLADVAAVVIPTLARHGVAVLHYPVWNDGVNCMRTEFMHGASASRVWCDVPLIVDRQNMQGYKSATTYAKRIGLESLSGVAPEDDDGNAAAAAAPKQAPRPVARKAEDKGPSPVDHAMSALSNAATLDALADIWRDLPLGIKQAPEVIGAKDNRKRALSSPTEAQLADDHIPYAVGG